MAEVAAGLGDGARTHAPWAFSSAKEQRLLELQAAWSRCNDEEERVKLRRAMWHKRQMVGQERRRARLLALGTRAVLFRKHWWQLMAAELRMKAGGQKWRRSSTHKRCPGRCRALMRKCCCRHSSPQCGVKSVLSYEDFIAARDALRLGKSSGEDGVPVELFGLLDNETLQT